MDKSEQIRRRLKEMAKEFGPDYTMLATVKAVDMEAKTCTLYNEESELEFFDVRLRPIIDSTKSEIRKPKLDTWALAIKLEDSEDWLVIAVGEMEEYLVDCDNIVYNGGTKGGLVNWPDAKAQHDLVKAFINAVKNVVTGVPIPEAGSGANSSFQAALSAAIGGIDIPSFEGLEDTKVKH